MPDFKRFWALDSPDGWYANYIGPTAPYHNIYPLMGIALEVDDEGAGQMVGVIGTKEIVPADQEEIFGSGWIFLGYFLRGSMSEAQEAEYFDQLRKRGQEMGKALEEQNKRPEFDSGRRSRRRAR